MDVETRNEILKYPCKQEKTVIMVSHDVSGKHIENELKSVLGEEKYSVISQCGDCTKLSGGEKQLVSFARCLLIYVILM